VPSVRFTDAYPGPVRVVRVRERWTERKQVGQDSEQEQKEQNWTWVVAGDLAAYDGAAIRDIGHLRWKIENNAFGEPTQHWHLTHCAHHHPVAVVALLWIKIIAFTLLPPVLWSHQPQILLPLPRHHRSVVAVHQDRSARHTSLK
jgi:hypothetical protein